MPNVNGTTYPELNIHPIENNIITIALLDAEDEYVEKLIHNLSVLRKYLADRKKIITVNVLVASTPYTEEYKNELTYETFDAKNFNEDKVISFANTINIDVFYSCDKELILNLYKRAVPFELAETIGQLELEIEAFLTGKNIPWSLNDGIWNATLFSKYVHHETLMGVLSQFHIEVQNRKSYTPRQVEFIRALVNKTGHIKYCEEILVSYVQKKNFSSRNCLVINTYGYEDYYDYHFEINYHLGNYYFLMSGCLDIVGRFLADLHDINIKGTDVKPNIEHDKFQTMLKGKSPVLHKLYTNRKNKEWMIWLKRKRNFVAHESALAYVDVIKPKKTKLTQAEVEKKVNSVQNWSLMRAMLGDLYVEAQKEFTRSVIRMKEDNEIYTKEAMEVTYYKYETKSEGKALFHPLVDIKIDYETFEKLLLMTVKALK